MLVDIDVYVEITPDEVKEAVVKTIMEHISPANYGVNYLDKQQEIKELLDAIDFAIIAREIKEKAEANTL